MTTWHVTTEDGARVVDRDGVRQFGGTPTDVWHYIAAHADDQDEVCVHYQDGRQPTTLSGGSLRMVLEWTRRWP
jgi:carotenoid cleavage dioxygenase-like enzyme